MPLVATAVGAILALGGAVLGDRMRSRAEHARELRSERLSSHLEFVTALDAAFAGLRAVADPAVPIEDGRARTDRAVTQSRIYEAREKLLVSASPAVVRAAERVLDRLGDLRQVIADGAHRHTVAYHDGYHAYAGALWRLRQTVRDDLGNPDLSPADVGKRDWDSSETCAFCRERALAEHA